MSSNTIHIVYKKSELSDSLIKFMKQHAPTLHNAGIRVSMYEIKEGEKSKKAIKLLIKKGFDRLPIAFWPDGNTDVGVDKIKAKITKVLGPRKQKSAPQPSPSSMSIEEYQASEMYVGGRPGHDNFRKDSDDATNEGEQFERDWARHERQTVQGDPQPRRQQARPAQQERRLAQPERNRPPQQERAPAQNDGEGDNVAMDNYGGAPFRPVAAPESDDAMDNMMLTSWLANNSGA